MSNFNMSDWQKVAEDDTCDKSSRMRQLARMGCDRKTIRELLGVSPQFVYNTLSRAGLIAAGQKQNSAEDKYRHMFEKKKEEGK